MNYEENNKVKMPLGFYLKRFLLGFLIIVIFIFLLLWGKSFMNPFYDKIFDDNLDTMKEVATAYYTIERLPQETGDSVTLTLQEMYDMKLLRELKDKNGKACDPEKSYVKITRLETEWEMKVFLSCENEEDYIIVYVGCYDYCLNNICEKEEEKEEDPDKPTPPTETVYKYQYKKIIGQTYTAWSDWSANKEYTSSSNITWGKQEFVWNEKNGSETTEKTTYTYAPDYDKPIYHWKETEKVIGTYKQYLCDDYTYYKASETSTTYQTSSWKKVDTIYTKTVPKDTSTTRYVYKGLNYEECHDTCTLDPVYIYEKQTRTLTAETRTKEELSAVCNV